MMLRAAKKGFTLIEVLVYLALLALLLGGMLRGAYLVFDGSERDASHALLQAEGDFLLRKISWVLSGAQAVALPAAGAGTELSVTRTIAINSDGSVSSGVFIIQLDPQHPQELELQVDGGVPEDISNRHTQVISLRFYHATTSLWGAPGDSVGIYLTLATRTPEGALLSEDFIATSTLK